LSKEKKNKKYLKNIAWLQEMLIFAFRLKKYE